MVDVAVLQNDLSADQTYLSRHGLSLWISTQRHNILFDFGPNEAFIHNAKLMGIDISAPDFAVLSHGHYDHGGGILAYFVLAPNIAVYAQPDVVKAYYGQRGDNMAYIGLPKAIIDRPHFHFSGASDQLAPGVWLLAQPKKKRFLPAGNQSLFKKNNDYYELDAFEHEQSLLLEDGERWFIFSGCSHRGILNIMDAAKKQIGRYPDVVFGGLHLKEQDEAIMDKLCAKLAKTRAVIYSGHCTDAMAFARIKDACKDKARLFVAGQKISL